MKVVIKRVAGGEIATDKRFCEWTYEGKLSRLHNLLGATEPDRYSGRRNIICVLRRPLKAIWVVPQEHFSSCPIIGIRAFLFLRDKPCMEEFYEFVLF